MKKEIEKKKEIKNTPVTDMNFVSDIKSIVNSAREYSYCATNLMQVASNRLLGWRIVEQIQQALAAEFANVENQHITELQSLFA